MSDSNRGSHFTVLAPLEEPPPLGTFLNINFLHQKVGSYCRRKKLNSCNFFEPNVNIEMGEINSGIKIDSEFLAFIWGPYFKTTTANLALQMQ